MMARTFYRKLVSDHAGKPSIDSLSDSYGRIIDVLRTYKDYVTQAYIDLEMLDFKERGSEYDNINEDSTFEFNHDFRKKWEQNIRKEQQRMCNLLSTLDGQEFKENVWKKQQIFENVKVQEEESKLSAQEDMNYFLDKVIKANSNGEIWEASTFGRGKIFGGGGGVSKVLQNSRLFDKAAINVSSVNGLLPRNLAKQMRARNIYNRKGNIIDVLFGKGNYGSNYCVDDRVEPNYDTKNIISYNKNDDINQLLETRFYAAGLSIIIHPKNPRCPTVHANFRFIQLFEKSSNDINLNVISANYNCNQTDESINNSNCNDIRKDIKNMNVCNNRKNIYKSTNWWFGGGIDLTPYYIEEIDIIKFHKTIKEVCDKYNENFYPCFKHWADKYFFIPHRGECRGVGGIFFDNLSHTKYKCLIKEFVFELSTIMSIAYLPILVKNVDKSFSAREKWWHEIRRGRYVEFNLLYDRGTKFGLLFNNLNVENVLSSLPLTARWEYQSDEKHLKFIQVEVRDSDEIRTDASKKTKENNCNFVPEIDEDIQFSEEIKLLKILRNPIDWIPHNKEILQHFHIPSEGNND